MPINAVSNNVGQLWWLSVSEWVSERVFIRGHCCVTCACVGHDGPHVGEVHVDQTRLDDDLRDTHHTLAGTDRS